MSDEMDWIEYYAYECQGDFRSEFHEIILCLQEHVEHNHAPESLQRAYEALKEAVEDKVAD